MATDIKYVHGKRACSCQVKTVKMIEARLRKIGAIKKDLSGLITQGAFNATVSASARTHVGGGVWDVHYTLVNTEAKRRAWRKSGAWATYRTPAQGRWPAHGHVVWIGCPHVSTGRGSAANQIAAFKRGRNGLISGAPDDAPRFTPIPWQTALRNYNNEGKTPTVSLILLKQNIKNGTKHVRVKNVQKALKKLGYYKLTVDGVYGPKTRAAYKAFQAALYGKRAKGVDGIPGKASLTKLGTKSGVFKAHQFV